MARCRSRAAHLDNRSLRGNAELSDTAAAFVATPAPAGSSLFLGVYHYHHDHLSSVQLMTDAAGSVRKQVRYRLYGEIRGYYSASGGYQGREGGERQGGGK
jgi:hypothetical protein